MYNELNLYYCDHNDVIAERIGDILEDMGMFEFTTLLRHKMNLFGMLDKRADEVVSWYDENRGKGGKVNIVIFLTKFIKGSPLLQKDLRLIRRLCRNRRINVFTIVDDEIRRDLDYSDEIVSWIYEKSVVYDVTNSCIIADTIDVARSMTMELVKQRYKSAAKRELPQKAIDKHLFNKSKENVYIKSIKSAYEEIPENDWPSKFLLIFSTFKYVEHAVGSSPYSKCMEYLLKRSVRELLMNKKDLELSQACLMSEIILKKFHI